MKIIITSGPTRSYLDEIRYITNYSTGELGTLIAGQAAFRGHKVTQIFGRGSISTADGNVKRIEIETVEELLKALKIELKKDKGMQTAVIHAMAVLDYVAPKKLHKKVKSDKKNWTVKFIRAPKIIKEIKKMAPEVKLVGFKMEYKAGKTALIKAARTLMKAASADYVVANDFSGIKAGKHTALILGAGGYSKGNIKGKDKIASEVLKTLEGGKC